MQLYGGSGFPQVLIHLLIEQICLKEGKWLDEVEVWLSNLAPRCSLCSLKVVWKGTQRQRGTAELLESVR